MDGEQRYYMDEDGPPKVDWVIHKLPIKSGTVIRAAIRYELFFKAIPWSTIEGVVTV